MTGPVTTASGQVVSASNVDQLLLHDQYVGETYTSDSTARIDELSTLASATLHALENRPFKLHAMADALSAAAEGRHVLLWSADTAHGGGLARCRRVGPAPAVVADGRHHQPGREQAGPVPVGDRLPPADAPGPADRREPDHDLLEPHAAGTVPLHRRAVPGSRHRLRRVRRDRHRQPPRRRPRHHVAVEAAPSSPAAPRARPSWRGPPSTSCRGRRRASPSTSCCPRPTAP